MDILANGTDARILVTLGPASLTSNTLEAIAAVKRVSLLRLNLSHVVLDDLEDHIRFIQGKTDIPICLDSEGAQLRTGIMKKGSMFLRKGSRITVHHDPVEGDPENISFTPPGISRHFQPGDIVNLDFNTVAIRIEEVGEDSCRAIVLSSGEVGTCKAADVARDLPLNPITPKDMQAFEIGAKMGIRNYALSFASSAAGVNELRDILPEQSRVISKIESRQGLMNLESIIEASDEILIDRGDLSRQVPIEKIPYFQRLIISKAVEKGTPALVATNLMESMIKCGTPTRAEVNDVVSTLLMGAQGLVLAAETAVGRYPVETVNMVNSLINLWTTWNPGCSVADLLEA